MSKIYTYDAWVRDFQPMANHLRNQDHGLELSYETYGDEDEYVRLQDNNNVWTEVDGDAGCYIVSGYHWVNRIQYYITNKPWSEDVEVPTWAYRECGCADGNPEFEWDGYDPDCKECDQGTIDIPVDTVVDLKNIYGDEVEIIG